jgi:hypothetical protein
VQRTLLVAEAYIESRTWHGLIQRNLVVGSAVKMKTGARCRSKVRMYIGKAKWTTGELVLNVGTVCSCTQFQELLLKVR